MQIIQIYCSKWIHVSLVVYFKRTDVGCETFEEIASSVDHEMTIDGFEVYSTDMDTVRDVALSNVEMTVVDDDDDAYSLDEVVDHIHFE